MRLLLDTKALLFLVGRDLRLGRRAARALRDPRAEVYVSAASIQELAIKTSLGKLRLHMTLQKMSEDLIETGMRELPVLWSHAQALHGLPWHHKDPFDRMLIAQALCEDLVLVSDDRAFEDYEVNLLW